MEKATKVLYLDLDGTVRKGYDEIGKFVNKAEDVEIFEGVPALIQQYKQNGYRIVGITNQGGVSLGHVTFRDMQDAIIRTNELCGNSFDKIMVCIHHPDAKELEYAVCWCRKPRIGNIVEAAIMLERQYDEYYPPHLALFVGDRPEDKECAENANITFMDAKEWRAQALDTPQEGDNQKQI